MPTRAGRRGDLPSGELGDRVRRIQWTAERRGASVRGRRVSPYGEGRRFGRALRGGLPPRGDERADECVETRLRDNGRLARDYARAVSHVRESRTSRGDHA